MCDFGIKLQCFWGKSLKIKLTKKNISYYSNRTFMLWLRKVIKFRNKKNKFCFYNIMCTVQYKVHTVCIIKLRDTYVYIVKGDGIASWHATKNTIHIVIAGHLRQPPWQRELLLTALSLYILCASYKDLSLHWELKMFLFLHVTKILSPKKEQYVDRSGAQKKKWKYSLVIFEKNLILLIFMWHLRNNTLTHFLHIYSMYSR